MLAWRMEGMHGIDVCRRLRLHPELPSVYVLLLAGDRGEEDLLDGVNAGADDFLFAPLESVEVKARVRTGARIVEIERALRASQDALRVQSTRDAITGSWNRAAILDLLHKERERARRKSGSVGDRAGRPRRVPQRSTSRSGRPSATRCCARPRGA